MGTPVFVPPFDITPMRNGIKNCVSYHPLPRTMMPFRATCSHTGSLTYDSSKPSNDGEYEGQARVLDELVSLSGEQRHRSKHCAGCVVVDSPSCFDKH